MNSAPNYKIESLNLFVTKTDEVKGSSYTKFASQNKISVFLKHNIDMGTSIVTHHPNEEAIKSLILTLRLFLQDNDRISISNTLKYMKDLNFDGKLIEKYERGRKNLNNFLDSTSVIYNGEMITYRKVINVFFYGYYAHIKKEQYEIYKRWKRNEFSYAFRKNSLLHALNDIIRFVLFFKNSIKLELERIRI